MHDWMRPDWLTIAKAAQDDAKTRFFLDAYEVELLARMRARQLTGDPVLQRGLMQVYLRNIYMALKEGNE
jgi:hypothetical protein